MPAVESDDGASSISQHNPRSKKKRRERAAVRIGASPNQDWAEDNTDSPNETSQLATNEDPRFKRKKSASMDDFPDSNQREEKVDLRRSRSAGNDAPEHEEQEVDCQEDSDDNSGSMSARFNKKQKNKQSKRKKFRKLKGNRTPSKIIRKPRKLFKKSPKTITLGVSVCLH